MSGCWALDGPSTRSMMPLHRGLQEQALDAKWWRAGRAPPPPGPFIAPGRPAGRPGAARPPRHAYGRPPVPPCRPSGVRGISVLPGGFGGSLPGRRSPCARSGLRLALPLPLLRAPAWPGRSGSPPAFRCAAPARGPLPAAAGPGRPLAAGGPCAAVAAAGFGAGRFSHGFVPGAVSCRWAGGLMPTRRAASYNATRRAGRAEPSHLGGSVPPWAGRCHPGSAG